MRKTCYWYLYVEQGAFFRFCALVERTLRKLIIRRENNNVRLIESDFFMSGKVVGYGMDLYTNKSIFVHEAQEVIKINILLRHTTTINKSSPISRSSNNIFIRLV